MVLYLQQTDSILNTYFGKEGNVLYVVKARPNDNTRQVVPPCMSANAETARGSVGKKT